MIGKTFLAIIQLFNNLFIFKMWFHLCMNVYKKNCNLYNNYYSFLIFSEMLRPATRSSSSAMNHERYFIFTFNVQWYVPFKIRNVIA